MFDSDADFESVENIPRIGISWCLRLIAATRRHIFNQEIHFFMIMLETFSQNKNSNAFSFSLFVMKITKRKYKQIRESERENYEGLVVAQLGNNCPIVFIDEDQNEV